MAWGKVKQFQLFLWALSPHRVSRYAEVDPWPVPDVTARDDGWEYQAMRYTPTQVIPGNHP